MAHNKNNLYSKVRKLQRKVDILERQYEKLSKNILKKEEKCDKMKKKMGDGILYLTMNMCTYVKMEHIVATALVELCEKKNIRKISLNDIRAYGISVEKQLINNKVQAILLYSDNYTKQFLQDYSDFFELIGNDISIKDNITVDIIREHILSYISSDVLFALFSKESLLAINIA